MRFNVLVTFLRVHSNSKEVSYLSWQNMYPNLKTLSHIKLKFFLWTKLLENLVLAKYLICRCTFNVHHKDWLTYSGGTDWPGELCYNFSFSNDLTQMVNFPTWIPDCDSHGPALLDLLLTSDASICSTISFPPLGNSYHVAVWVSIYFSSNCQWDALFHHIAYEYSRADWESLPDHLRDVPWEDIFKLGASAAASLWVGSGWNWFIHPS